MGVGEASSSSSSSSLTVLSAEPVARRKSSKGEKSKSVTRSVGEEWLTQAQQEPTRTSYFQPNVLSLQGGKLWPRASEVTSLHT